LLFLYLFSAVEFGDEILCACFSPCYLNVTFKKIKTSKSGFLKGFSRFEYGVCTEYFPVL
jgi:hypothetical protein